MTKPLPDDPDDLPDLDPEKQLMWDTRRLIRALKVSSKTFYHHKRKLGIIPRKKSGSNARWYSFEEGMQIAESIYQPLRQPFRIIKLGLEISRRRERNR